MKNKSKLIIGIFLISGVILLGYMGTTNMIDGSPPEQDGDDPGNSTGPGIYESAPSEPLDFISSIDLAANPLRWLSSQ